MALDQHGNADAPDAKPGRRRMFFINPAFQWKYTIAIALTVFLTTSVISTIIYSVLHEQARMRVMQPHTYVSNVASVVLISAIALSGVTAAALAFWCIIATHRICGPIFVLQRYMSQLAAGQIPTLRPLRKKDEFKELYAVCTRAVESLKIARRSELTTIAEVRDALAQAESGSDARRREALHAAAGKLEVMRDAAEKALGNTLQPKSARPAPAKQTSEPLEPASV